MRRTVSRTSTWRSGAGRTAFLAALAAAAVAGVFGVRSALADRHRAVASVHGGARLRITSKPVLGLYPGATQKLTLMLSNRDHHRRVVVARLRVLNAKSSRQDCETSRRNLAIRQYAGPALLIRPRATRRAVVWLTMPNTVADACQKAVFTLRYSAEVTTGRRHR